MNKNKDVIEQVSLDKIITTLNGQTIQLIDLNPLYFNFIESGSDTGIFSIEFRIDSEKFSDGDIIEFGYFDDTINDVPDHEFGDYISVWMEVVGSSNQLASAPSKSDDSQSTSSDFEVVVNDPELVFENEPKAINLVGNFKYNSNSKYILDDVLGLVLDQQFGDNLAEVLDNPSTERYWIGWMYPKYSDPNIWEVTYKMKTYNFNFEPHFIVDLTTGKVSAANDDADDVLQILKKIS